MNQQLLSDLCLVLSILSVFAFFGLCVAFVCLLPSLDADGINQFAFTLGATFLTFVFCGVMNSILES